MMNASALEYRFRYLIHALIYALGFLAPWERYTRFSSTPASAQTTTWLSLAASIARSGWLGFSASSRLLLVFGCVVATLGAWLSVWGASYLGAAVVNSGALHGDRVLADGPFRHSRNPLYLGAFLNTLALSLLMLPTGAIFTLILIALVQLRLIGAEESFLTARLGQPYLNYRVAVPRLVPSLRPRVASAGDRPDYGSGVLSELFVVGTAVSFIALGFRYNSMLVIKGVLVSFGLSLIARAFFPKTSTEASAERR